MNLDDIDIQRHETCYQGFFRIERYHLRHRLFDGSWSNEITRELFERGHAAAVLPYDPVRDEVVLIEQFRIGALEADRGPWLLEIVAGMIENGETAETVARRETLEEAGCTLQQLIPICNYLVSPGGTSEQIQLFCGHVDASQAQGLHGNSHEDEDIRVSRHSFNSAMTMIKDGRLNSASPIIALQWLALNRTRIIQLWT